MNPNCLVLAVGQGCVAQFESHGGFRRPFLIPEQGLVGKNQVHPRRFNVGQCAHCVLKFPFERTLVVHSFVKLRAHPIGFVEQFKTKAPALQLPLAAVTKRALSSCGAGTSRVLPMAVT